MQRKLFVSVGQRIGRGTVVDADVRFPITKSEASKGMKLGTRAALLICDCGNEYRVRVADLITLNRNKSISVGCEF